MEIKTLLCFDVDDLQETISKSLKVGGVMDGTIHYHPKGKVKEHVIKFN